jgi:hypothetical protein
VILADCPTDVAELFVKEFNRVNKAINTRDLSEAQFPRVGAEAMIELVTRRDLMQWVLEMLNVDENYEPTINVPTYKTFV